MRFGHRGAEGILMDSASRSTQDPETHRLTDFMSFYSLPSLIMKHAKHKDLGTAYLFYYATDAGLSPSGSQGGEDKVKDLLKKRLNGLVNDCLVIAKEVSPRHLRRSRRFQGSRLVTDISTIQAGFDVFNALTMMDNNLFLNEQMVSEFGRLRVGYDNSADESVSWQFGPGDGYLVSLG